jgi:hypothetical protein
MVENVKERVGKHHEEETVVKRFPERYLTAVNTLIEHLEEAKYQDGIADKLL